MALNLRLNIIQMYFNFPQLEEQKWAAQIWDVNSQSPEAMQVNAQLPSKPE